MIEALPLEQILSTLNIKPSKVGEIGLAMNREKNRRLRKGKDNLGCWSENKINEIASWAIQEYHSPASSDAVPASCIHAYKSIIFWLKEKGSQAAKGTDKRRSRLGRSKRSLDWLEKSSAARPLQKKRARHSSSSSESIIHHERIQSTNQPHRVARPTSLSQYDSDQESEPSSKTIKPKRSLSIQIGKSGLEQPSEPLPPVKFSSIESKISPEPHFIALAHHLALAASHFMSKAKHKGPNMSVRSSEEDSSLATSPSQLILHNHENTNQSTHSTMTLRERELRDFKILILDDEFCYVAYMTISDIVPADAHTKADIMDFADLDMLKGVLRDQVPAAQNHKLVYRGEYVITVRSDVLLRFALKEAYYEGHKALRLLMESQD